MLSFQLKGKMFGVLRSIETNSGFKIPNFLSVAPSLPLPVVDDVESKTEL